jgi:glycosyltransferase involved in cell wall biosynthesis
MNPAPVSVVIPTYNCGGLVSQAVGSVLAQSQLPAEIIVVDDGSGDDTQERLAPFGNRIRYVYQENQGVAAARNLGVQVAQGDLIAFLDADDIWHPRKLKLQLEVLRRNPELGLLGTTTFDWPAPALPIVPELNPVVVPLSWQQLVVKNYFATSTVVVRREVLRNAGLFDTELQGPEDHDLWLRVAEGAAVAKLRLPLTGYRYVDGSLSNQPERMQHCKRRILQKLDARQAWQGRWLLRRKAYSHLHYSCAHLYREAGCQGRAVRSLLNSMAWYPYPYHRYEVRMPLERPKTLAVTLLRLLREQRSALSLPGLIRIGSASK